MLSKVVHPFLLVSLLVVGQALTGASARRRQGSGSTTVSFDGETYSLDDPSSDHRSEGIKRSEANDNLGAVDSFRAALQFEKHDKGGAHMNLGVALMRLGNHRDAATAKQIYFDSLEHFENAETLGTRIGDNKKAIYDNCEIRYKEHCDIVFADLRGGVRVLGTFAKDKKGDDDWEADEDDEDWEDDEGDDDDDLFSEDDSAEEAEGKAKTAPVGGEDDDWEVEDEDWAE